MASGRYTTATLTDFHAVPTRGDVLRLPPGSLLRAENINLHHREHPGKAVRMPAPELLLETPGSAPVMLYLTLEDALGFTIYLIKQNGAYYIKQGEQGQWEYIRSGSGYNERPDVAQTLYNGTELRYIIADTGMTLMFFIAHSPFLVEYVMPAPDCSGVVTSLKTVEGGLTGGIYQYIFCFRNSSGENGEVSQPLTHNNGSSPQPIPAGSTIRIKNLPQTAHPDCASLVLYRTRGLTNTISRNIYYECAIIEPGSTFYDDACSDDELSYDRKLEFSYAGLSAGAMVRAGGRLFLGNVSFINRNPVAPALSGVDSAPDVGFSAGERFKCFMSGLNATGLSANGVYIWRCVFVDEEGNESLPADTPNFRINGEPGEYFKAYLQLLPSTAQIKSQALPVIKRRLYRTKSAGLTFYYLRDLPIESGNTFEDALPDDALGYEYAPSSNRRLPAGVVFSGMNSERSFPLEHILRSGLGGRLHYLQDTGDGVRLFGEQGVEKLYRAGAPEQWRLYTINDEFGVRGRESVCVWGERILMLSRTLLIILNGQGVEQATALPEGMQADELTSITPDRLLPVVHINLPFHSARINYLYDIANKGFTTVLGSNILGVKQVESNGDDRQLLTDDEGSIYTISFFSEQGSAALNSPPMLLTSGNLLPDEALSLFRMRSIRITGEFAVGTIILSIESTPEQGVGAYTEILSEPTDVISLPIEKFSGAQVQIPSCFLTITGSAVNRVDSIEITYTKRSKRKQ